MSHNIAWVSTMLQLYMWGD